MGQAHAPSAHTGSPFSSLLSKMCLFAKQSATYKRPLIRRVPYSPRFRSLAAFGRRPWCPLTGPRWPASETRHRSRHREVPKVQFLRAGGCGKNNRTRGRKFARLRRLRGGEALSVRRRSCPVFPEASHEIYAPKFYVFECYRVHTVGLLRTEVRGGANNATTSRHCGNGGRRGPHRN
jgi:hypothetical protein